MSTKHTKTSHFLARLRPYLDPNMCEDVEDDLIRHPAGLTEEQRRERENTALHEAAHFVAACACKGSTLNQVFIHPTGNTARHYAGRVLSGEVHEEESLFVTMAGIEWERLHTAGDATRAIGDVHDAAHCPPPEKAAVAKTTAEFLFENYRLVVSVALAFMALSRRDGYVGTPSLKEIARWTRVHVVTPGELAEVH